MCIASNIKFWKLNNDVNKDALAQEYKVSQF